MSYEGGSPKSWENIPCTGSGSSILERGRRRVRYVRNFQEKLDICSASSAMTSVVGTGVEAWALVMNRRGNGGISKIVARSFGVDRRSVDAMMMYYRRAGNTDEINSKVTQTFS